MKSRKSFLVAFSGMMAALGVVLMLLCGVIPILTYTAPLFASLMLIPVITELGIGPALMVWAVTGLLSLFLCADKEAACFYIFVGHYPVLKHYLDRISVRWLRIVIKILTFAVLNAGMYAVLLYVLKLDEVVADFTGTSKVLSWILSQSLLPVLLIFDFLVDRVTVLYTEKIRKKIGKG